MLGDGISSPGTSVTCLTLGLIFQPRRFNRRNPPKAQRLYVLPVADATERHKLDQASRNKALAHVPVIGDGRRAGGPNAPILISRSYSSLPSGR
jgi:hypothetical protein